ncbi:tetratricopeptide repeat protein [Geosporobacter ferrireducens]|uniref:DUF5107 domain-containing protein n=1 Tax=Geosporobacter ferrireducens TaxID=1424294 RepID=A0A1D8GFN4_9FIRM|nr:hypothetical protein [Geosporobacter ferrireducens]AOT69721.1 hypothetical protein Gferi_09080 [Geosporobacter ferrireducens]MTI54570.1 hypothetical protein [Geosporobacter ferrireducens]
MKRGILFFFLILIHSTLSAYADDTVLGGTGQTVYPIFDTNVKMMSEQVDIHVRDGKSYVQCTFLFHNTGETEKLLMGFPAYGTLPPREGREAFDDDVGLYAFKSYIDEKEVGVEVRKGLQQKGNNVDPLYYPNWYVWEMEIKKGEIKKVVNSYWMHNTYDSTGGETIQYVLKTGATWKGEIEYGKITIVFDDPVSPQNFSILDYELYQSNKNVQVFIHPEDKSFIWEFYRLEPDFDIGLYRQEWQRRGIEVLLYQDYLPKEHKEGQHLRQLGLAAIEAYEKGDYEKAMDAIKKANQYKESQNAEVASYALEVANLLDYYRGMILKQQGDYKGAAYYLKLNGLSEDYNLYELANVYRQAGELDQYIQTLKKIIRRENGQNSLRLWGLGEINRLPARIKESYELMQLPSAEAPITKDQSEIQNESGVRGPKAFFFPSFLLFNGGVVILILVLYWNIKRR